jgi:hypothetical protein
MKTKLNFRISTLTILFLMSFTLLAQTTNRSKIGIISVDTKGLPFDNQTMTNMFHLELEKLNVYEVYDKYDVADLVKRNGIKVDDCFGKTCLVGVGKMLNADKMITGSAEKFGDKIILIVRLIDVTSDRIEKTDVMEYIYQPDQIQMMIRMSLNNIVGKENDKYLLDLLVNFDQPITSSKTTLKLNGPRVGFTYTTGEIGNRMRESKETGGFDMYPVTNMIGYQFEKQFLSSGDFQALFELIPAINGMESGMLNPSLTGMLGFRFNKSGVEFGLGPTFRLSKVAYGFYDENNKWVLRSQIPGEFRDQYEYIERIDSRGNYGVSSGMIFAAGKTFRSGYLNMPINLYYSPRKDGSVVGFTIGFNVATRPKLTKTAVSGN